MKKLPFINLNKILSKLEHEDKYLLVSRKWEVLTRIMKDGIFSVDDRMLVATTSVVLFRMSYL